MDNQLGKKKVLIVATIDRHISSFHLPLIKELSENGFVVDVASNGSENFPYVNRKFDVPFTRNPVSIANIRSFKKLKNIIRMNNYDIIHCHTPVGGAIGRLAANGSHSKVIYTAHGLHFFEGAPLKNWILFYPVEKFLSQYTDIIITINMEDFKFARKKFKRTEVKYIPGVGVDFEYIKKCNVLTDIRKELNISQNKKIIFSVGELNENKNHEHVIKSLSGLSKKNWVYLIAGEGTQNENIQQLLKEYKLDNSVKLLGYRTDVISILKQTDLFIFPSKREGLPVSVMEAMACEVPVVVSDIRGNRDLILNGKWRFPLDDTSKTTNLINTVLYKKNNNVEDYKKEISRLDINTINKMFLNLYKKIL